MKNLNVRLVEDPITREDIQSLSDWLLQIPTPRLTKGELTVELEKKWAEKIGTKYSVFVNSGSSAILLALYAMKFMKKRNNKIVVPGLSWATDLSSPLMLGMDIIPCDCNLHDLSLDLEMFEHICKTHNPSMVILVSPLGLVPDMEKILSICNQYDVILFEDVCESMGSKYKNKYLGSFGFASFFSMYYGHHLSTIEGGFINTNDEDFYHKLLMLRSHGWDRDLPENQKQELKNKYNTSEFKSLYTFYLPGINLRSTDLQAFIGLQVINRLDEYGKIRNKNFKEYKKYLLDNDLNIVDFKTNFISSFAYPLVSKNKNNIVEKLKNSNIEIRPLIAGNIFNNPAFAPCHTENKILETRLKNCDLINDFGIYLPNHQNLNLETIFQICKIINEDSK